MSAVADKCRAPRDLGCEVFSVRVDSHFVHKMWDDHELTRMVDGGIPFRMLCDRAGNIGWAYGVDHETQGIELRGRFIVDPDGVIQAMEVLTPPVGRRIADTVRQVQACQVVRSSGGTDATPAGWMAGDPVLRPGPALVGNVWKAWKPTEWGRSRGADPAASSFDPPPAPSAEPWSGWPPGFTDAASGADQVGRWSRHWGDASCSTRASS